MNTQQKLVERYKQLFPKDTFQIISNKTNIQITRVFRIFNGSEMKISEYIKFQEVINRKLNISDFQTLSQQAENELSEEKLSFIKNQIISALKIKALRTTNELGVTKVYA